MNVALSVRKGHREKYIGLTNFRYSAETYSCSPYFTRKNFASQRSERVYSEFRIIHCDKAENGQKVCFFMNTYIEIW
jgi:hypothetical protein